MSRVHPNYDCGGQGHGPNVSEVEWCHDCSGEDHGAASPSGPSPAAHTWCEHGIRDDANCSRCGPSPAAGLDPEVADLLNRAYDHLHLCTDGDDPLHDAILARLSRSGGPERPNEEVVYEEDGEQVIIRRGPSPAAGLDVERLWQAMFRTIGAPNRKKVEAIAAEYDRLSRSGGEAPPDAAWTDAMDGGTIYVPSEPEDR